jgi:putative endonuclease
LSRIALSAELYLSAQPRGSNSDARIDVALVDGRGFVEIIENIYAA